MINQILYLFVFSLRIFSINCESCTIPSSGVSGNCVTLNQCPTVQEEFRKDRTKLPVVCNKSLRTICCPTEALSLENSLSFRGRGIPESQTQTNNNQQYLRLNEVCTNFRKTMTKNVTISSFIIDEPEELQLINYCNTNQRDIGVAEKNEFPHVAYIVGKKILRDRNGNVVNPVQQVAETKCSGSLITENFVLTTALCVSKNLHSSAIVHFGVFNLTSEFEAHSTVEIPKHDLLTFLEISLLRLTNGMSLSESVMPACLSSVDNSKFVLSGWTGYKYECNPLLKKWYIQGQDVMKCGKTKLCVGSSNIINYHETLLPASPLHVYHPENSCQYIIKGLFKRIFMEKYEFVSLQTYLPWIESKISG
ncbi:serine protease snake-like [Chironomus tepperi]|uniref:serine protease snake-like n=1 Tax=Chironomus tepperi TaxID=113505 RepID=UPI00391F8AAA